MTKMFNLNWQDAVKGLVVSVLSAVIALILSMIQNGLAIDWKAVGITAIVAGLGYVSKNFLTAENGKIAGKF